MMLPIIDDMVNTSVCNYVDWNVNAKIEKDLHNHVLNEVEDNGFCEGLYAVYDMIDEKLLDDIETCLAIGS